MSARIVWEGEHSGGRFRAVLLGGPFPKLQIDSERKNALGELAWVPLEPEHFPSLAALVVKTLADEVGSFLHDKDAAATIRRLKRHQAATESSNRFWANGLNHQTHQLFHASMEVHRYQREARIAALRLLELEERARRDRCFDCGRAPLGREDGLTVCAACSEKRGHPLTDERDPHPDDCAERFELDGGGVGGPCLLRRMHTGRHRRCPDDLNGSGWCVCGGATCPGGALRDPGPRAPYVAPAIDHEGEIDLTGLATTDPEKSR